jgi:hypothetical protein
MARVKVKVDRGNGLQQTIVIDTAATQGATLGSDVYLNGAVATPEAVTSWLGLTPGGAANIRSGYGILISGTNPKTVNVNRAAAFDWQGQHSWEKPLWAPGGTAALPAYTFTEDQDTGLYRVGANNIGLATNGVLRWDVNTARALHSSLPSYYATDVAVVDTLYEVFRAYNTGLNNNGGFTVALSDGTPLGDGLDVRIGIWTHGNVASAVPPTSARGFSIIGGNTGTSTPAQLQFLRYDNSATGVIVLRVDSDTDTLKARDGTAANPAWGFINDPDTGLWLSADGQISVTTGGTNRLSLSTTQLAFNVPLRGGFGSAGAPTYSFTSGGVGSDTGMYAVDADTLGFSANNALRFQIGGSGQWGIGGATYGTSGDLFMSGGGSAAPSWGSTVAGAKTWSGDARFNANIGFNNTAPIAKPTVSGSRADPEAALANLLTALANYGLITNSTTA